MTTRIYKIEKFIPKTGSPVFQVWEQIESDGRTVNLDPRNPTEEEFEDADDAFAASQQASLTSLTAEGDDLRLQLHAATEQLAEVASLRAMIETITGERDGLQTQLDAANQRIEQLLTELPWDKRIIDASAFLDRIKPQEMLALFGSDDSVMQQIAGMLKAYKANDWPIMFESPEMQQAIGYLQQVAVLTPERVAELLSDSMQFESYKAGE